jgi:hypothetical protein
MLRGYTSCFVVVVVVVAVVACLLIIYSTKQFENLPLQQGNSHRVHAVWYPATSSDFRALVCSLRNCHCSRAAALHAV